MSHSRHPKTSWKTPLVSPPVALVDRARMGLRVQGRYRIVSELEAGALGTVCLADDEATNHEVAIRFLPQGSTSAPHPSQPVRRRSRSVIEASTAHPALVGVLDFGTAENGQTFVVMEVARGRRLSEILAAKTLDVVTALRWAVELGGAIETLHNMGIVHGALRPRNVMIGDDGSVKLMDVELTDLRDELARTGMIPPETTAEYLSPEQIRHGPVSEKTDVYAFAVILYEMLCGVPPFRAATPEATLAKHLTEAPIPMRRRRRAVSPSVESMVALALSKQTDRRPLIHTVLNLLWQEAHVPAARWKRRTALLSGTVVAASVPVILGCGLFMPRSAVVPLLPPSTPPVVTATSAPATQAPVSIDTETLAVPAHQVATPVRIPETQVGSTSPSTPPTASRARTSEPSEQARAVHASAEVARARPAARNDADDPDPGAVVDWLLERAAAHRK